MTIIEYQIHQKNGDTRNVVINRRDDYQTVEAILGCLNATYTLPCYIEEMGITILSIGESEAERILAELEIERAVTKLDNKRQERAEK